MISLALSKKCELKTFEFGGAMGAANSKDAYKTKMVHLVSGYLRNCQKELEWVLSDDIGMLCFDFFYDGQHFEYQQDYDENGILYWLATKGLTAQWRNPCKLGAVRLYCSRIGMNIHINNRK